MKLGWGSILLWLGVLQPALAWEGPTVRVDRISPIATARPASQNAGLFSERRVEEPVEGSASGEPTVIGNGEWRVQPLQSVPEPLLLIHHPYNARVTVRATVDGQLVTQDLFDADLDPQYSRRALVFPLSGRGPVHVRVENARYPLRVAVESRAAHAADDLTHVRILMCGVGMVVGVSLAVLLFWAMLRDRVYLLYAVSMLLQLLYVLCSYGEAYAVPVLQWLAVFGAPGIWAVATLASMSIVALWLDYAGLHKQVPRLAFAMRGLGLYLPGVLLLLLALPWPRSKEWFPDVANGVFLLTNLAALAGLTTAWCRGSRHAAYAMIAWIPLLVFTTWRALQLSRGAVVVDWVQYGLPLVLAFTAVVLALGLADRMLTFRRERDSAKEHAERDALTGVLNRGGIEYRLDWAVLEKRREGIALSLLFIDLDFFKKINDRYGHALGDACLRAAARAVSEEFQYGDQLGRLGGEEFVLVLAGADAEAARQIAERVRIKIERSCAVVEQVQVGVTASIGVAECLPDDSVASLIARADQAMYAAKRAGGNQVAMQGLLHDVPAYAAEAPEGA
jgi:diguanylate cyclase (GGDEF)-like protein